MYINALFRKVNPFGVQSREGEKTIIAKIARIIKTQKHELQSKIKAILHFGDFTGTVQYKGPKLTAALKVFILFHATSGDV